MALPATVRQAIQSASHLGGNAPTADRTARLHELAAQHGHRLTLAPGSHPLTDVETEAGILAYERLGTADEAKNVVGPFNPFDDEDVTVTTFGGATAPRTHRSASERKATGPARSIARPATERQINYLRALHVERKGRELTEYQIAGLTAAEASAMIDTLKAMPRLQTNLTPEYRPSAVKVPVESLTAGVYRTAAGEFFRVYPARSGSHMLAKRMITSDGSARTFIPRASQFDEISFEYAGAATRFVKLADRLSADEAARFGAQFGVCMVCGAALTDPDSVAAGIGPVCKAKYDV
jgi:hypothetical protein